MSSVPIPHGLHCGWHFPGLWQEPVGNQRGCVFSLGNHMGQHQAPKQWLGHLAEVQPRVTREPLEG